MHDSCPWRHQALRRATLPVIGLLALTTHASASDPSILGALPEEFTVQAIGVYEGGLTSVVVNKPGQSVVLILTAYESAVWRVGRTAETNIAGVLVSGYHSQTLIGAPKETPSKISSYEKKGDFPYFLAYKASPRLLAMNDTVLSLVGREIDHFQNEPEDHVFYVGDRPARKDAVIYSDEPRVQGVAETGKTASGLKALRALVEAGRLRPATSDDIAAWVDKASDKYRRFNPRLRVETPMKVGRTYVVLDTVTLPDGLFGRNSRAFIVPDRAPLPSGPLCHNRFYKMEGTATGPGALPD
ncbi:MAG: hypothetical protein AAGJ46_20060 [Planctomycetota bacterium]